ncbi:type IVB secretion system protein IcmV [Legionella sp. CNM-4043-24]|uniref:type IVB secretion system protein IcmV n=1 Tax=Legionella sp. CNM-4043-24 TaxID=3421646 RepID=UPI00403AEE6F
MSIIQIVNNMKKQKKSRIAGLVKSVFNVRAWMDFDRIRSFTTYLGNGIRKMVVPEPVNVEDAGNSFNEMVAAQNLSEKDLADRARGLYRLSMIMLVMASAVFVYALWHLVSGNWKATIVSLVVTSIGLVLAFRYHFWYFQIKERKLGCTFQEWYKRGLLGERS